MVTDRRGFGERLKRHRERAGITLEAISRTTKVPVALFAGLEAGDCSRWPAGLFARAYVRSYAETIGLNPEDTVEEFAAAFGMTLKSDGVETQPPLSARAPGALRLALVEDSLNLTTLGHRAGLAASELLLGVLIAAIAQVGFDAQAWVSVGLVVAYFAIGRLLSDDPLLYGLYKRARHQPPAAVAPADAGSSSEVSPVGDTASTVA
jgi:transcriptional regulator with XRE-family HTH domain